MTIIKDAGDVYGEIVYGLLKKRAVKMIIRN